MTHNVLEYPLVEGFIHNWLVAGPQAFKKAPGDPLPDLKETPLERSKINVDGESLSWSYYRCLDDHLIDLSAAQPSGSEARAWAYAKLVTPTFEAVSFNLFASGPVVVRLNGQVVFESTATPSGDVQLGNLRQTFQVPLRAENELYISFAVQGGPATRHSMGLQLTGLEAEQMDRILVRVPTRTKYPHRLKIVEALFDQAYLERFVHPKGDLINIRWAENAERMLSYSYKVQDISKQNYVTGNAEVKDEPYDAGHPQRIWERPMFLTLQAPEREYWDMDLRYERRLPMQVLDTDYATQVYESYVQRRRVALEHASRREPDLFAEIAKMVLEKWEAVEPKHILQAVDRVKKGDDESPSLLVGLLGMLARFEHSEGFPKQVAKAVESAALDYSYPDAAGDSAVEAGRECQVLLTCSAAILAGQRLSQRGFRTVNMKGSALRRSGEDKVQALLRQFGQQGFTGWHSDVGLEALVVALTHLASLAKEQPVRELAAVLLDKIFFLLAVNSHQGIYGAAHSRTSAAGVKSGQMLAGTAINRLLFGVGVYNRTFAAPVSLACSEYEFPSFFAQIATQPPKELLHKERQVGSDGTEANLVSYRTPDYLLSSVQDYRPGQPGHAEQVWQATLGPDAVVFTNHPARMGELEPHQPGFWLGNAVLPRIAQWKDNLVAVYNLPPEDWMGYTHAHFPMNAFDETVFARGWAFGRVGEAFIGLTCSAGFEPVKQGVGAFRELRAVGRQVVWLCVLGRQAVYRGFRRFQKKCMAIEPDWKALGVSFTSAQGDEIAFGWQGPLMVNGEAQALGGFKHIENPFCTTEVGSRQMDIQYDEILMRLNFE